MRRQNRTLHSKLSVAVVLIFTTLILCQCNYHEDKAIDAPVLAKPGDTPALKPGEMAPPANSFKLINQTILASKCFGCHGKDPTNIKGDVDFSTYDSTMKTSTIKAGKPEESNIYTMVISSDGAPAQMPPGKKAKLTETETKTIATWILNGAKND